MHDLGKTESGSGIVRLGHRVYAEAIRPTGQRSGSGATSPSLTRLSLLLLSVAADFAHLGLSALSSAHAVDRADLWHRRQFGLAHRTTDPEVVRAGGARTSPTSAQVVPRSDRRHDPHSHGDVRRGEKRRSPCTVPNISDTGTRCRFWKG